MRHLTTLVLQAVYLLRELLANGLCRCYAVEKNQLFLIMNYELPALGVDGIYTPAIGL